ncbi:hypothetical protein DQ04_12561010 [Trypanosoma grayi]|uniref:hypothetical protein n=1 Tax=Trypanosoma grayi TaxID=71804 RepID=UPI0004F4930E|nr:hypothetical protein DQ04_12561010 [Trypanosoma grayi]KEG06724.1 hypothetical protein DQ04_12561010 [Trypanosoma grayi]
MLLALCDVMGTAPKGSTRDGPLLVLGFSPRIRVSLNSGTMMCLPHLLGKTKNIFQSGEFERCLAVLAMRILTVSLIYAPLMVHLILVGFRVLWNSESCLFLKIDRF